MTAQPTQTLPALPQIEDVTFELIQEQATLEAACQRWRDCAKVALDTEFVRERTFYPALGLIQIAAGAEIALIDPTALSSLEPFVELLTDPTVTKILHSCSEDLEVLSLHLGALPEPLLDTQVAAALAGRGFSPGYARLITDLFAIEVPKGETRSNWLRRPLRPAQLHYAALDVAYLLQAETQLAQELEALGRTDWLSEEMRGILETARRTIPDEELYLRVGRARHLSPRNLAILRDLHAWRQAEARKRDLPRSFVVKDAVLLNLAQRPPKSWEHLIEKSDLDRRTADRHGRALLRVIRTALSLAEEDLPQRLTIPTDLTEHLPLVSHLRDEVGRIAEELGVAPETLSNRRTVEEMVRRFLDGAEPILPEALRGWRAEIVGSRLLASLANASRS